ncbi:MmgE/PrpD family protein [Rubrobacter marinus]
MAKILMLDALGIAFASRAELFAEQALAGVGRISGDGGATVVGSARTVDPGSAALLNGLLIHGLDFDDTHLSGVLHTSAGVLPAALAAGELEGRSGREVLRAFVLGTEVAARVGMAAAGRFHKQGFHPTGVAGAFGAAVAAGLLFGLDARELATAQGIVGSMASGILEFLEEGTWTKRVHPGWSAKAGLTAASLAGAGFTGPSAVYEGRYGLYASHLGTRDLPLQAVAEGLGERWEVLNVAVKPYPACHFVHAFIDAALELLQGEGFAAEDVDRITCKIAAEEVEAVCEPVENKRRPKSTYDAQFSVPYVVASAIVRRRRLGIKDFDEESIGDEAVLDLAGRVDYEVDPEAGFPDHFSGEVVIALRDGRTISWREQVNRGAPDRPLGRDEIREKFDLNASVKLSKEQAALVAGRIEGLDESGSIEGVTRALRVETGSARLM